MNLGQLGQRPGFARKSTFTAGGYLTPVSGTPVITADALNVSSLFYAHDSHNGIPIMRGGQFEMVAFDEPQIPLAGLAADTIYDLVAVDGRTGPRFGWAPAWQSSAAGAGARGTGVGFNELRSIDGVRVNRYPIRVLTREGSVAVGEKQAAFLASVSISAVAGVVNFHRSYGQARTWPVSNAVNRKPIILQMGTATASWSGVSSQPNFTASENGSVNNRAVPFTCLPDEQVDLRYQVWTDSGNVGRAGWAGILLNATSGTPIGVQGNALTASAGWYRGQLVASAVIQPGLGINNVYSAEAVDVGATFNGTQRYMQLTVAWRG